MQGDGALLTPEERRQMNDYEAKMQNAMRVGRKARHQKTRLIYTPEYINIYPYMYMCVAHQLSPIAANASSRE